jgi:lysophospholipase L1-like esterase
VDYRFDSRGSRGLDRESPAPPAAFRIVLLGDSYTLGVGVREEDTFASQLERRLNLGRSGTDSTYFEVINSGVTGFDTHQERALYETVSHLYEPDLVLVVMNYDDDMTAAEVVDAGFVPPKPRLSRVVGRIASAMQSERTWDYSRSIEDLKALAQLCGERGQRLGVVFMRGDSAAPWTKLIADVTAGLEGTNIPILDLGNALLGSGREEAELRVHASDPNYNEIAHGIAAEELEKFLRSQQLLPTTLPLAAGGL